jgi:hypothetical protein
MEAASVAPVSRRKRQVLIAPMWLGVCGLGAVIAIVGMFLKAVDVPAGLNYPYTNTVWSAANGGKGVFAFIVATVVLLALAVRRHRQRWLRVAYFTSFAALAWAVLVTTDGFTLTLVGGGTVKADSAIGPVVMTVGCAVMFASLLIARFTEKRV